MREEINHKDLRERFNPEGSRLRALQTEMLTMLKDLDEICRRHGIEFWLSSGTCLGAVRHEGFIPWDDDVDVEMYPDDYRRLVEVINGDPDSPYVIQTHKNDPGYYWTFGKLKRKDGSLTENDSYGFDRDYRWHGPFIDLFIMTPSNSRFLHRCGYQMTKLAALSRKIDNPLLKRLYRGLVRPLVYCMALPLLGGLSRIGAGERRRHKMGGVFHAPRMAGDIMPLRRIRFEDTEMPVPADTDAYLRGMFGDYMKLPDLDKIPRHYN